MKEDLDLGILPACRWVAEQARFVKIDEERLRQLAREWAHTPFQVPEWDDEIHWTGERPAETAHYILLLDALNFCFWAEPGQPRWRVEYRGKTWNGYKALAVALGRALDEGVPLLNASYLAEMQLETLRHLLRGSEGEIPLLEERLAHTRQIGLQLRKFYEGQFANCIAAAGKSARALTRRIARDFPCFHDVSHYKGREIPIYKRAQITVVDLAGALNFQGLGGFDDLDQLTAFADYKIPQVLRAFGIMVYAPELADRVDRQRLLAPGSEEEVEIRAVMVWAVERLRQEMAEAGRHLKAYELDWFLWNVGQQPVADEKPYHRTRTVFY